MIKTVNIFIFILNFKSIFYRKEDFMQYIYNTEKRTLINAEDIMKILKSSKGDTKIQELENLGKIKNNFEKFIEKKWS